MSFNREKLAQMVKPQNEEKKDALRARRDDNGLRMSQDIALLLHYHMRIANISQVELAARMGVSPVFVHRILKGTENLTLDTIGKIESAIGKTMVSVPHPYEMTVFVTLGHGYREPNHIIKSNSYAERVVDDGYKILNSAA